MNLELYQTEHLVLLVGGNPLPNVVAGRLLLKQTTGRASRLTLLYSNSTAKIALRLETWLKKPLPILQCDAFALPHQVERIKVDESDPANIFLKVSRALDVGKTHSIGLHYTGGTKAMAVHAYRAMQFWARNRGLSAVYSYLDARTLRLVIDPHDPQSGQRPEFTYVGRKLLLARDDLFALHNWQSETPVYDPVFLKTSQALLQTYLNDASRNAWEEWKADELNSKCRRENRPDKWLSKGKLSVIELDFPSNMVLSPVVDALRQDFDQQGVEFNLQEAAQQGKFSKIEKLCKWLDGGYWLESVVLEAFKNIAQKCHLHEISMNIVPERDKTGFELDLMAMRGYQLFAVSCCTASENEPGGRRLLKHKLFEAVYRARQLGGDEARVTLICFAQDTAGLQAEAQRDIDEHIKVFGQADLLGLFDPVEKNPLARWIQQESREEV